MNRPADAQNDDATGTLGRDTRLMLIVSAVAVILGAGIAIAPFVFEASTSAMWNNVIVGVAIILLGGFNYYRMMSDRLGNVGVSSLVALLGLWALFVPFALEMGSDELFLATSIAGLLVALAGGYNAFVSRRAGGAGVGSGA